MKYRLMRCLDPRVMVTSIGRFAAIGCEPRQVRKEAAVTTDSGAKLG